jgi:hypothetical protein
MRAKPFSTGITLAVIAALCPGCASGARVRPNFDRAVLQPGDREVLARLAECVAAGVLRRIFLQRGRPRFDAARTG